MAEPPVSKTSETGSARGSQVFLDSMPLFALICCYLPEESVCVLAQCSRSLKAVATCDTVWLPRAKTLLEDNADVCVDMDFPSSMQFVQRYRHLRANLPSWRALQAVERFQGLGYESLRELGVVINPGLTNASFLPFDDISLPITAQAALELVRCFRAQKGKGKPCIYKKAALLLGRATLQHTLRVAEGTLEKHNKKMRSKEPLGNFLLSSWPAARGASSSSATSAGVQHYVVVKVVGKTKEQRAVERSVVRETAKHAKTKWERDFAREGWANSSVECDELRLQASEAGRLRKLVARLQKELAGKIDVDHQRVLEAQVLEADRKLRASLRQQEDAETKSSRILQHFRFARLAAEAERLALEKERARLLEREQAVAKQLEKAASMRSNASVVDAELRAEKATAEVERLEGSLVSMEAARKAGDLAARSRESELLFACETESSRAAAAQLEAAAVKTQLDCTNAEKALLQRDLLQAFDEMRTAQQNAECNQANAVVAAQRKAELAAAQQVATLQDDMVRATLKNPKELSATAARIFAAVVASLQAGEVRRVQGISLGKDGVITRRGQHRTIMATIHGRKGVTKVGRHQLRKRTKVLHCAVTHLAGGEEHVSTLLADHAKANPTLYKQVGLKLQQKLDVEQTAALCNETSGMLGASIRRHLKACGIDVASKADVHEYFKASWEKYETGMVTIPDPKHRGRMTTGAWLRVSNLTEVMENMMRRFHKKGKLAWHSNIPADECWFELIIDKGSSATKLVLKYCCIDTPDSVRNVSLVGILDRVKDAYDMMGAFKPIFDQLNQMNCRGKSIWTPWRQALPEGFKAAAADGKPIFAWQEDNSNPTTAAPTDAPVPAADTPANAAAADVE
eukprot:6212807-Pleurochrysis_carterae.AAC.1